MSAGLLAAYKKMDVSWSYADGAGPTHWGKKWVIADEGQRQSPIDLPRVDKENQVSTTNGLEYTFNTKNAGGVIIHNDLTIRVDCNLGSTKMNGCEYEMSQFHFHAPAEHTIDGKLHDLELHFVHCIRQQNHIVDEYKKHVPKFAVIGVLFKVVEDGKSSDFLKQIFDVMPISNNESKPSNNTKPIHLAEIELDSSTIYRYDGSLTTPPCSEDVCWTILQNVYTMSKEQLEQFRQAIPFDNNRPTQPIYERQIQTDLHCNCEFA